MEKIVSTTIADRLADGHVSERLSHRLGLKPVLVGRDLESSFLENYLDAARDGQGHVVLISGKSGMGKTRLVQELMSTKTSRGEGRIMIGFCRFQKKMTPYYPLRQIMSGFVEKTENGDHGERIVSCEGLIYPQFPWDITFETNGFDDGEGSERQNVIRRKLFYNMCQYLFNLAKDNPLLIVLEDIQWSDVSSIQFVHFLARNISRSKILLIATHDPEELFSTGHELNIILQRIAREVLIERLELQGISQKETERLVRWYFPEANFSDAFFHSVHSMSQGNPYLLKTTLELLLAKGDILEYRRSWSNTKNIENYDRQPVMEIVRRRLRSVNPASITVLEYVAAVGDRFMPEIVSLAMGITLQSLRQVLEELTRDYRMFRQEEDEYCLDHTLVGHALYSGMDSERRRTTHQQIGEAMEQLYGEKTDGQVYDLAFHFALSAEREKALYYLGKAGDESRRSLAFQEALHYSTVSLSLFEPPESIQDGETRKMRQHMFVGEMNQVLNHWENSMEDFQQALALAEKLEENKVIGVALMQIGLAYAKRGMWIEAESFYTKSIDMLKRTGAQKQIGLARTYLADINRGRCEWQRAEEMYEEALNTAMRTMNRRLMARIYSSLGAIADIRGDLMKAMVHYNKSLNLYKGLEEYLGMASVYQQLGNMHASGQKWDKALEFYDRCISLYDRVGEVGLISLAYLNKAVATLNLLAVGKAEKLCDIAQQYLLRVEDQRSLAECNKVLGLIGIKKNEWHYAQRRFEESLRILEQSGDSLGLAQNLSEIGSVYVAHGQSVKALELLQQAFDLYLKLGIDNRVEELNIKIKAITSDTRSA